MSTMTIEAIAQCIHNMLFGMFLLALSNFHAFCVMGDCGACCLRKLHKADFCLWREALAFQIGEGRTSRALMQCVCILSTHVCTYKTAPALNRYRERRSGRHLLWLQI